MIDLSCYNLTASEYSSLEEMLCGAENNLTLGQLWLLMDQAWEVHGCRNVNPNPDSLSRFYGDPVWLLNGIFIEQHDISMGHRNAITSAIKHLSPSAVVDFGGGFGTLGRLLAAAMPHTQIAICEPYPPRHGIESCKPFPNIKFVPSLASKSYDVLVSTDVLEHVPDPLALLALMVDSVRPGGHLVIANCFFPVIACHLPATFHLRHSFNFFAQHLGLDLLGPCYGSHAHIYRRAREISPNWPFLRTAEKCSKYLFFLRKVRHRLSQLSPST